MSGGGYLILDDVVELSIAHIHAVSLPLEPYDGTKQTDETQVRLPSSIKPFASMTLENVCGCSVAEQS